MLKKNKKKPTNNNFWYYKNIKIKTTNFRNCNQNKIQIVLFNLKSYRVINYNNNIERLPQFPIYTNWDNKFLKNNRTNTKVVLLFWFKIWFKKTQYLYLNIKLNLFFKLILNFYYEYNSFFVFVNNFILFAVKWNVFQNLYKYMPFAYSPIRLIQYTSNFNILLLIQFKSIILKLQDYNKEIKQYISIRNREQYLIENIVYGFLTCNKHYKYSTYTTVGEHINLHNVINYKYISSYLYKRKLNNLNTLIVSYLILRFKHLKSTFFKQTIRQKYLISKKQSLPIKFNYLLNLLEETISFFEDSNLEEKQKLISLYNLLLDIWKKKNNKLKKTKYLLAKSRSIVDFKLLKLKKTLISFLENNPSNSIVYKKKKLYTLKQKKKLYKKFYVKKVIQRKSLQVKSKYISNKRIPNKHISRKSFRRVNQKKRKPISKYIRTLKQIRIMYHNQYYNYEKNKELISLFFGFPMKLYYINALSLTRFEYQFQIKINKKNMVFNKKKSSKLFITKLEREFLRRYKFIANSLKDFIRIGLLSFYTKNLSFLMKYVAFQIMKLQKNRKETRLIRFLIKALKVFSAQRPEIIALKVQFKGRVNRWRRTKIITGLRGYIPFYSYKTRLEYATATAVTRKGALGIRFWLYYTLIYHKKLELALIQYLNYTTFFKQKKIKKTIQPETRLNLFKRNKKQIRKRKQRINDKS